MTITVLVAAMAADYLYGMIVASVGKSPKTDNGGMSSKIGSQGLCRKGMMILVVLVAALLDRAIGDVHVFGRAFPIKIRQLLEHTKESNDKPPDL